MENRASVETMEVHDQAYLYEAIQTAWWASSQETTGHLIDSMPHRTEEIYQVHDYIQSTTLTTI